MIRTNQAFRYTFTKQNNSNIAAQIDIVERNQLTLNKPTDKEYNLLINPAKIKTLNIDGKAQKCVLSYRFPAGLPAWIRIADLDVDEKKLKHFIKDATAKWSPAEAKGQNLEFDEYIFIVDDVSRSDNKRDLRYIMPRQDTTENRVKDYLAHDKGPGGRTANNYAGCDGVIRPPVQDLPRSGRYQYIGISQSLPQADAPPVFIDFVLPGASFFVPKGKDFHREIGIYHAEKPTTNIRQMWVYGFIGQIDGPEEQHASHADRSRFGWVPLRTLKKKSKSKKPK